MKVSYQPREQVIIHEYSRYNTVEDLVRGTFAGVPPGANVGPIKWTNGIVFNHISYPMTDVIVQELLQGRLHWDHVSFAPMDLYQPLLAIPDLRLNITIADVSPNPVFRAIAEFIKETLMRED
jgi:hypothetical protein